MNKVFAFVIAVVMIFSTLFIPAFAAEIETTVSETVEYLDDGYYIISTLTEEENVVSRATSSKSGSKTVTLYNSDDEKMVQLKLTGVFSYTGSSATCTSASISYTVYSDNWKVTSATASKSGNKAIGEYVAKRYVLLIPVQTYENSFTITCSNSGTLS